MRLRFIVMMLDAVVLPHTHQNGKLACANLPFDIEINSMQIFDEYGC